MKQIVPYEKRFGEYTIPDELKEKLQGLPLERQLDFFRTTEFWSYCNTGWTERRAQRGYVRVEDDNSVKGLIVDGGVIVGVMITQYYGGDVPCFLNESVCTYYACDNNGAGYKEREDYTYFVAVSENFEVNE